MTVKTITRAIVAGELQIDREGLGSMLQRTGAVEVVAEASSLDQLLDKVYEHRPNILFVDMQMAESKSEELLKNLRVITPGIKVIVVSSDEDKENIQRMIDKGISGYILRKINTEELDIAVQKALGNIRPAMPSQFHAEGKTLMGAMQENHGIFNNLHITKREKEILTCLCNGFTTREISTRLNMSLRTVEGHRAKLIGKTNSRNTVGLVAYAFRNQIIYL